MPRCDTTEEFLDSIRQKFKESDKEIINLMSNFTNGRYDNICGIKDSF